MDITHRKRGCRSLIKDIYPGEKLNASAGEEKLMAVFNPLFDTITERAPHLARTIEAVKLYYQIDKKSTGDYCRTIKEVGETIGNKTIGGNKKGVTGSRAASLVKTGLRVLRHPARRDYFEPFFQRGNF